MGLDMRNDENGAHGRRAGLPLLIGVGPVRSGTTWAHEMLFGHSQVATTAIKEVNYFNRAFDKGDDWYRAQFAPIGEKTRLRADLSPLYMLDPEVPGRIEATVADPIIMINLRSPYARTMSWWHRFGQVRFPNAQIETDPVVHEFMDRVGLLTARMRPYLERFGRDRVVLADYDLLQKDPQALARELQTRLGLDLEMPATVDRAVNTAVDYRSTALRRLVKRITPAARKLSPHLFYKIKYSFVHEMLLRRRPSVSLTKDQTAILFDKLKARFEPDIDELEKLLERNLSAWRIDRQLAAHHERRGAAPRRAGPSRPGQLYNLVSEPNASITLR